MLWHCAEGGLFCWNVGVCLVTKVGMSKLDAYRVTFGTCTLTWGFDMGLLHGTQCTIEQCTSDNT